MKKLHSIKDPLVTLKNARKKILNSKPITIDISKMPLKQRIKFIILQGFR